MSESNPLPPPPPPHSLREPRTPGSRALALPAHLVVELRLNDRLVDKGAEVGRLVPPDRVVVHVHLPQAAHHFHLVLGAVVVPVLAIRATLLALAFAREGEAIRDFERAPDVKAKQLARDERRQRLLAVFDDLEDDLCKKRA